MRTLYLPLVYAKLFAFIAEILRKGGGAFDAISLDLFFTMRDLQECGTSAGKDVWPMKSR